MVAFCRITETEIRTREPIPEPDVVVVQNPALLNVMDVFAGFRLEGYVLLNSMKGFEELSLSKLASRLSKGRTITSPTLDPTRERVGRPVPNAIMLGGIAVLTKLIRLQLVINTIRHRLPGRVGDANISAVAAVYGLVAAERGRVDSKGNADV